MDDLGNFDKLQEETAQLLQTDEVQKEVFYSKKNKNLPWLVVGLIISSILLVYILLAKVVDAWPFNKYSEPAITASSQFKLPKSFQE
ncbi:MAG: hypothetical protein KW804_01345 [Candidatus Doudnabacteria bacterium]|nr:hypothetical protein [Candidatus Doudnabacteria bacterium]